MATFVQDTFTLGAGETAGEDLATHHGEIGATWTSTGGSPATQHVTAAGRTAVAGTASTSFYTQYNAAGTPTSADYTVQADLSIQSLPPDTWSIFVLGRQPSVASASTFYAFGYDIRTGWTLQKDVAGTVTTLGSAPAALAAGALHTIALHMQGSSLWGTVDGATVVGPLTDTSIAAAGLVGFYTLISTAAPATPSDTTWAQLDNFVASDLYNVAVTPATATLGPAATQQFSATVSGTANQSVTWSVVEAGGGTITAGGLYTAPSAAGTYHVQALAAVDGTTVGAATVAVALLTPPGPPLITIATASGQDTIGVSAAVAPGSNPVAGYRLYAGASAGAETDTGLTISPTSFPASFPAQPTATAGTGKYYVVRAYDTAAPPTTSAASNEVWSRITGLVPSGTLAPRVFVAPYGAAASGLASSLGYTVYDYQGAVLQPHTTGHTYEVPPGSGIYAALVSLDTNYAGVLVWDAPSGSGPYVEAFDAGAFAQVAGYAGGLDPASMILQSPAHKLLTNASGQVDVDWSEAIPATASGLTLGRAALAAIAEGVGVWKYDPAARTLVEYAEDGATVLRSFALTIDGAGTITQRA